MLLVRKLIIFLLLICFNSYAASITSKYDRYFQKYTKIYFPYLDWKWFKAQSIAESSLNPNAKSYVGALGLMQVMPGTAKWLGFTPEQMIIPELAIHAGIKYDYKINKIWAEKEIPFYNRMDFIFSSYNAGPGNILKAYKLCKVENKSCMCVDYVCSKWYNTSKALPKVTGKHSKETITYVERIRKWFKTLQIKF